MNALDKNISDHANHVKNTLSVICMFYGLLQSIMLNVNTTIALAVTSYFAINTHK